MSIEHEPNSKRNISDTNKCLTNSMGLLLNAFLVWPSRGAQQNVYQSNAKCNSGGCKAVLEELLPFRFRVCCDAACGVILEDPRIRETSFNY